MPMNASTLRARLGVVAAAAVLAGCSMIPKLERPEPPVASAYPLAPVGATANAADVAWSRFVTDARLRELIGLALKNNRDLRLAALNIEQVRAQYQIQRANQFPTVNVGATGNRQPDGQGGIASTYSVGFLTSAWEIDVFGRLSSLKEAALAQYLASEEARKAVQTSLVAQVASTWLALQADEEQLAVTRQTLRTREDSLRLTRLRFDNGAASALDLRQAESLAAAAQATLAQQERQRALDLNALTLLLGQTPPAELVSPTQADAALPEAVLADVPAGLPSDLLTRRADIRQAEQQLVAANANIGAARAAFFPRISLTASVGTATSRACSKTVPGALPWRRRPCCPSSMPVATARGLTRRRLGATSRWRSTKRPFRPPSAKWPTPWPARPLWASNCAPSRPSSRPRPTASAWPSCVTATAWPATWTYSTPSVRCLPRSRR